MSGTAAPPPTGSAGQLAQLGAAIVARPYARRGISMSSETIRIVLVDDHAMVREGLRLLLRMAPDIVVVGEAADRAAAVDLVQRVTPDIVVLDLDMPGGGTGGAARAGQEHALGPGADSHRSPGA